MRDWYRLQQERDRSTIAAADKLLGAQKTVFEESVGLILDCLDAMAGQGPIDDLPTRRKIALANYGVDVLWSAWSAVLAGRYSVACGLWRTADEARTFLMAIVANSDLASQMGMERVTIDIYAARRAVRDGLNRERAGAGDEWHKDAGSLDKSLHALTHTTAESTGAALAIWTVDGTKIGLLRPGGVLSEAMLKPITVYIASLAVELAGATMLAFSDTADVDELWQAHGRRILEQSKEKLGSVLTGFSAPQGDVARIFLLRHEEDAPPEA